MEFRLLGPLEVLEDRRTLPLGGRKQRALLALLLLHAGEVVSRDRLIDELWRGQPPASADTTLRSYLSRLRGALGKARLQRRDPGYLLAIESEELDARRFEQLAQAGRAALASERAGEAAELLREALALWRGPVAYDVRDELPPQAEAARLEELRLVAVEDRVEADLKLGRHPQLSGELERLIAEHPFRERFRGQLMRALYHSERQAEALGTYTKARAVLTEELGLEPGPHLRALQQAILRQELLPAAPAAEPAHNLPAELTSFVGRQQELADIARLLAQRRLVTLTGLGGIGKSRLALQAARQAITRFRDGVWLVALASLGDGALVPEAIAEASATPPHAGAGGLEPVKRHLKTAELLLLLDNCEHLLDPVRSLVEELLSGSPGLRVLATSREQTGAAGEIVYQVPPLALPGEDAGLEELAQSAAVRLFLDRAPLANDETDTELLTIAGICRELDGLPLAIELAAGRTTTLSPREIAERLNDRFRFLRYWRRVTPARHQTLLAAMDWSYELLTAGQQEFLRYLAVFHGGFTLASAAAVCLDGDEDRALELVEGLAAASLIGIEKRTTKTRYRLLETVRQYASTQLEQTSEAEAIRRRHAEFVLDLARSANLSAEAEEAQHHELVIGEQDNVRAALEWALGAGEIELAGAIAVALENFWVTRNPLEGMRWFERLLQPGNQPADLLRARGLRAYGSASHMAGAHEQAQTLYEQSLATFRGLGEERATALVLHRLGMLAIDQGDLERARPLLTESLRLARSSATRRGEAQALGTLGALERARGNDNQAAGLFARSAALCADIGRTWWQSNMLANLAEVALEAGRIDEAAATARQILALVQRTGDRQTTVRALAYLAVTATAKDDFRWAGRLWAAVEAEEARGPVGGVWARERELYAHRILDHAGPSLNRGLQEEPTLTLAQAIELASRP